MDILKLLSRSSKLSHRSSATPQLPSAGTASNPQLFNDPIPEKDGSLARGKKRKRGTAKVEKEGEPVADEEIDFFATQGPAQKTKKSNAASTNARKVKSNENGGQDEKALQPATRPLLDESECKQILRSHRLKITLLASADQVTAKDEKKKSKKRKHAEEERKAKPQAAQQLFPQPLAKFGELKHKYDISGRLSENLVQQGYKIPTEVQMGSLPLLLRPKIALGASEGDIIGAEEVDLLAVAPTGSGKTLAFIIPVIDSIVQRRRDVKSGLGHDLEAIVVAPTKELASQIVNEARKLAAGTGIKVVGMQKGMRITDSQAEGSVDEDKEEDQEDDSDEDEDDEGKVGDGDQEKKPKGSVPGVKANVLVTTPLVLLHALSIPNSTAKASLPTVRTLVLDEADVLLDPLFREQTLGIWDACTNPGLRATLWSATMGSNIETLATNTINRRRDRLNLSSTPNAIVRLVVGLKDSAIPNISHRLVYAATEAGKLLALRQLLHPTSSSTTSTTLPLRPPFLIFTQTIPRAIALHSELLYDIPAEAGGSSRLAVLHSDLSDAARSAVMSRFRNGDVWVLITTDILSRGVDFRGINGVVNYDVPNSGAAYIHRVGRTGRAGRDGGIAVTFYTKEDIPYVKNVANIIAASEKAAGKSGGEGGVQRWLLDALPTPTKEEKKKLRMHGVEARRTAVEEKREGKGRSGQKISTKSGFERREENKRRGAIEGSKRRAALEVEDEGRQVVVADGEWSGIDE